MWDRYTWSGLPSRFVTRLQVDQRGMRACVSRKTSWCKIHTSAAWLALLGSEGKRSAVVPRLKTLGAFILRCRAEACAQTALEHTHTHTGPCMHLCFCLETCSAQTLIFPKFHLSGFSHSLTVFLPTKKKRKRKKTLQPCWDTDSSNALLQLHAQHHLKFVRGLTDLGRTCAVCVLMIDGPASLCPTPQSDHSV